MNEFFEKIIENERVFTELASKQFSDKSDITRENIKSVLVQRGAKIRQVINETNVLIDEHISPYLKNPESLESENAKQLQELAQTLSGYKESIDTGLSFEIREALVKYSQHIGDDAMYINNTFYKALALFYLERALFKSEMSECYEQIIAFSDRYASFDKETRNLIARAYGNSYISVADLNLEEVFRRYDRALDFWENTAKKVDPDFPWDAFYQNLHENLCSTTITALRSNKSMKVSYTMVDRLLESAQYLYDSLIANKKIQSNDYTTSQIKHLYYYNTAKYYNYKMSANELLQFFYSVYKQADDEYTYDDLYKKLHVSALFLHYLQKLPQTCYSTEDRFRLLDEIEQDVFQYTMNIPDDLSRSYVANMLTNFALGSHEIFDDYAYLKMLLSLTVFRHAPTYVHSVMVARIAFTMIEYVIKHNPEKLIGMPGVDTVEDVSDKAGDILLFTWFSGLVHDIGKIVYSHMVSFYVRKLNDKEFEMIKQHSSAAKNFIKSSPNLDVDTLLYETVNNATNMEFSNSPELFSHLADVALGHHKSFDGKFGYPQDFDNFASPVKIVIDAITIADSIDAATDSVGRSYAREKTLEHMEEDLLSQIDTRYCPYLTKIIFEDKSVYKEISEHLSQYRYDIYHSIFFLKDFSKTMLPPNSGIF